MATDRFDLLQGTLGLIILKSLLAGRRHGYAVARWIEETTEDVLQIEEGSLYPALRRLEDRELIRSEWGLSENMMNRFSSSQICHDSCSTLSSIYRRPAARFPSSSSAVLIFRPLAKRTIH